MLSQTTPVMGRPAAPLRTILLLALGLLAALFLGGCALDAHATGLSPASAQLQAMPPGAFTGASSTSAPTSGQELAFAAILDSVPSDGAWAGTWQVGGQNVRVGPSTQIDERKGKVAPGARVAVEGWQVADGTLDAGWVHVLAPSAAGAALTAPRAMSDRPESALRAGTALTVPTGTGDMVVKGSASRWLTDTIHPVEYRGLVQLAPGATLTGTWTIGGHLVNVGPGTDLKLQLGSFEAGSYVQVIGWLQPDGTIDAAKVLVKKLNPGQGRGQPPATGITNTVPPTSTLLLGAGTGIGDDDEPDDQADGNRNWDLHLHGPVAGAPITNTGGLSYTLTVNGRNVIVDANTWLKAQHEIAAGDWLQVKGLLQPDGSILATSIQWVHRVPDTPGDKGAKKAPAAALTATPSPKGGAQGNTRQGQIETKPPAKAGGQGNGQGGPQVKPRASTGAGQTNGRYNSNGNSKGNANGSGSGNGKANGHK